MLADKHEISGLKTLASSTLETLAISMENMLFVATVANNYKSTTMGHLSNKLLERCLKFFFDLNGGRDNLAFICETKKNFPDADLNVLHELINVGKLPGTFEQDLSGKQLSHVQLGSFCRLGPGPL